MLPLTSVWEWRMESWHSKERNRKMYLKGKRLVKRKKEEWMNRDSEREWAGGEEEMFYPLYLKVFLAGRRAPDLFPHRQWVYFIFLLQPRPFRTCMYVCVSVCVQCIHMLFYVDFISCVSACSWAYACMPVTWSFPFVDFISNSYEIADYQCFTTKWRHH